MTISIFREADPPYEFNPDEITSSVNYVELSLCSIDMLKIECEPRKLYTRGTKSQLLFRVLESNARALKPVAARDAELRRNMRRIQTTAGRQLSGLERNTTADNSTSTERTTS